jgi:hypothetical protein
VTHRIKPPKKFTFSTGDDGLVSILCEDGFPLTDAMKFTSVGDAQAFMDFWILSKRNRRPRKQFLKPKREQERPLKLLR